MTAKKPAAKTPAEPATKAKSKAAAPAPAAKAGVGSVGGKLA